MKNWAGNLTYSTPHLVSPRSVEDAQELVAASDRLKPLGTRHSFNRVADSEGMLVSTEHLDRVLELDERTVTVEAGIRYGDLGRALAEHRLALRNYASLPHISVGGAVATATHGSGARNTSLAASVAALDLVRASGELVHVERGDADFGGTVVGLGALGLVVHVTLDVVPGFELRQYVFENLPWSTVEENLAELLALGYSTSLFTLWRDDGVHQVWVKSAEVVGSCFGATPAERPRHPIPGADPANCTAQLGVPGPSHERLPHFRLGFTPSGGNELQSEYAVPSQHAREALQALRAFGPRLTPLLLTSEIRAVAADSLWLSPFHERDSVCFHFTWKPRVAPVLDLLPRIEAALAPFEARPHWAKVFVDPPVAAYPRLPAFRALRARVDPERAFGNAFAAQLGI